MFWKITYETQDNKDILYYGSGISLEEKNRRIQKLKDLGYKIISAYKVKNM